MTDLLDVLFWLLFAMVPVWFYCVYRFSRLLRERHLEKYDDMHLDEVWPSDLAGWFRGHDNRRPLVALLRFLFRREDRALDDPEVSSLSAFMRWFLGTYTCLFLVFTFQFFSGPHKDGSGGTAATADVFRGDPRRNQAFDLHRAKKWDEAISAYDRLLIDSDRDAELNYWRGMAHWELGNVDLALQDFDRVIALEPTNFEAHRSADRIMSGQRRWDELLVLWDAYIRRRPADAEAYYERSGTNFHKGDLEAARADAAKACELGKNEACALVKRLDKGK